MLGDNILEALLHRDRQEGGLDNLAWWEGHILAKHPLSILEGLSYH